MPLLLERSNTYRDTVQRVAVVDCSEAMRIQRTMRCSAVSEQAVRAIVVAQLSRSERLAQADDVIHNDGDEAHLRRQIAALHERHLALDARQPRE